MINIGIIGCGKIASVRHIPEYESNPETVLYGFFDLNRQRAEELAEQYQGKSYGSYQELLEDPNIAAVSVLTPNVTHFEIVMAALEAGKDVLCEKPMATTKEECVLMKRQAQTLGRKLMIAHNQRLTPAHRKARELIASGEIGKVISFRTTFIHGGTEQWSMDGKHSWFTDKTRSCFGVLADLGIHKTDLMVYLLDQKITQVSAVLRTLDKRTVDGKWISVDDNAFCTYIMESGAVGTMYVSWTNYGEEDNSTSIYGTQGVLHIYKEKQHSLVLEREGKERMVWDLEEIQTNQNQTKSGVIDAFITCITEKTEPVISPQDVIPAMNAIFACVSSNEQHGKFVNVEP